MDSRFCAVCNRTGRNAKTASPLTASIGPADILRCLNETRTRATYQAVGGVLGLPAQSVGRMLGDRRAEASWVVNGDTLLPSGYEQADWHPDLLTSPNVIRSAQELMLHLALWRARQ